MRIPRPRWIARDQRRARSAISSVIGKPVGPVPGTKTLPACVNVGWLVVGVDGEEFVFMRRVLGWAIF